MTVHLFWAVSSPSCANFALRLTAQMNKNLFDPIVADTVLGNFYVDDCLKSVSSSDQAVSLIQQLTTLCEMGGFKFSKWVSNKREVLLSVPAAERDKEFENIELDYEKLSIERALGIRWSVGADTLGFKNVVPSRQPTRRNVLSIISSVYDPFGFAAPFILPAKILLQEMCRNNVQWVQELTGIDLARWQQWLNNLTNLDKLIIPRCFKPCIFGKVESFQIHNFSDASNQGYGMVSYLRLEDVDGKIHCSLLIGKSRVAPLKKVTVPRMELTAAMLAVHINKIIIKDKLSCQVHKVVFWTDSTSVLRWISNESAHFHTFVANRIHTIRESSESSQWRYVESKCNPADDASRGLDFRHLVQSQRWLNGPDFLWKSEENWPNIHLLYQSGSAS
ncbi:uncharacterized protein [Antedon mediterranea]|uniref:uncharacterized protein n=1 Tax=Antedon mediterranea TaxID=105859 RepID=UPI003AF41DDB